MCDGCSVNICFNATVPEFNIRATTPVALHPLRATLLYFSSAFLRRCNIGQETPSRLFPPASPRARRPQASDGTSLKVQGLPRVAQKVKNLPAMQETWVRSLAWENPLEEEMATHCSILAWRIPQTEKPGGLQSMGLQRVRHK